MSRLDEALRRSGVSSSSNSPGMRTPQGEVFESPWAFGDDSRSAVAAVEPPISVDEVPIREIVESGPRLVVTSPIEGIKTTWREWLVSAERDPAIVEQFKRLAATLLHGQRDGRLKVIMVTSAVPGEGKTLTALNLALVLADSYRRRVLLVDADLRRPRLSEAASLTGFEGLGEALKASDDRKVTVTQLGEYLTLLPAGRPDPEPLSGLTSPRMQHLIEEAAERYDWVIIDTPPVTAAADAGLLGAMVDATVLVVKAGETPHPAVRHAIDTLGRDRIFGVVLNGVNQQHQSNYSLYTSAV
jgi:capsular exopolysaccharide synthesis family protein